jgi:hypothetical protein
VLRGGNNSPTFSLESMPGPWCAVLAAAAGGDHADLRRQLLVLDRAAARLAIRQGVEAAHRHLLYLAQQTDRVFTCAALRVIEVPVNEMYIVVKAAMGGAEPRRLGAGDARLGA